MRLAYCCKGEVTFFLCSHGLSRQSIERKASSQRKESLSGPVNQGVWMPRLPTVSDISRFPARVAAAKSNYQAREHPYINQNALMAGSIINTISHQKGSQSRCLCRESCYQGMPMACVKPSTFLEHHDPHPENSIHIN